MGSLTVRNLSEDVKKRLRVRAAANGRSMEEEIRLLLAAGAAEAPVAARASAVLLATDRPVLVAPAMNPRMWSNAATRRNLARLVADGIVTVGPNAGEMAESGEAGTGRMAEPLEIVTAVEALLATSHNR